jgi:hypothetical protein
MKQFHFIAAVVFGTALAGTAYGAAETRSVAPFKSIGLSGSGMLEVSVGKAQSVVLDGDAELLRHITTTVEDGQLKIGRDRDYHGDNGRLTVRISLPQLAALSTHGSADATVTGLTGGVTAFAIDGSGDMTATGRLDTLNLAINGSGGAHFDKLIAETAAVTVNGSGEIVVQPRRTLASTINGSGTVHYIGSPQVSSRVHGSGSVRQQ